MKILFLTNLLPYPLDNGGKIKTYTTIKALSDAGHQIDLVCFKETENVDQGYEEHLRELCSDIYQICFKLTTALNKKYMIGVAARSLISKFSFGILKYISRDMIALLENLSQKRSYDCVYFDHLQMFVYEKQIKRYWLNTKIVLDEHNCEYMIMNRNVEKETNIIKKLFFVLEAKKLKKFESYALQKADIITTLSIEDDAMLKEIANNIKTTIIPIGMEKPKVEIDYKVDDLDEVNILFVGTLSWAPNNDGLIWYLEKVIPKMKESLGKFKLYIVGKNPGDKLKRIANSYTDIDIEITGYVDSVIPYYQLCDFMIVPLFVGSGQRVKIIEGFSYGMPIISTSIGAEGLEYMDGENILIADDVDEFIQKSKMLKKGILRKKLSERAKDTFDKNYSIDAVKEKICRVVEGEKY